MQSSSRRERTSSLPEPSDTSSLSSTLSLAPLVTDPARQSSGRSRHYLRTLEAKNTMNTVLSSMSANCAAINYSACVRLIGFPTPSDILSYFKVRTSTAPYPPPSSHPSRPSFDTLEAMIMDSMKATGKDYRTSRRRVRVIQLHFSLPCSRSIRRLLATDTGAW